MLTWHGAGMDCPRVRYPQLNDEIEAELAQNGYQVSHQLVTSSEGGMRA